MTLYLIYPESLIGDRASFTQGMRLWLMLSSFGTMDAVARRREAASAWSDLRDKILADDEE